MLKDSGDKVQAADKSEVESALAEAKKHPGGAPKCGAMKAAHEKLTAASHKLAEVLYKANAAQGPAGGAASDGAGSRAQPSRRRTKA